MTTPPPRRPTPLLPWFVIGSLAVIILAGVALAISLWARSGEQTATKNPPAATVPAPTADPHDTFERTDDE